MSRIFISHASADNECALEIRDRIAAEFGVQEIFLDLDPQRGIVAGESWVKALENAAERCQVVVALISRSWLSSDYCRGELTAARVLGKRVIPVIIDDTEIAALSTDLQSEQIVNRYSDPHWWTRLREGLRRARLDPSSFEVDERFSAIAPTRIQQFPLSRMPIGNFRQVIEGPARLQQVRPLTIDPKLTDALLQDLQEQGDALPLLAFTLEKLYEQFGRDGDLRFDEYEQFGGVLGAIEAVERYLRSEALERGIASDGETFGRLMRAAFIPHLIDVGDTGEPVRRLALLDSLPAQTRPLVDLFITHHLLGTDRATDAETSGTIVEVTHEALLRNWPLLRAFVDDVREDYAELLALQRATAQWEANTRNPSSP